MPRVLAIEMIATGESMVSERALAFGVVNYVVPAGQVLSRARGVAILICGNAPLAVRESIRIARLASGFEDPFLRSVADESQAKLQQTADYAEGTNAFIEKRKPRWNGC